MSDVLQLQPPAVAGDDFVQAPWDYLCLGHAIAYYICEHTIPDGRDPKRIITVAKHAFRIWGPEIDVTKIDRPATRHYIAVRTSEGAKGSTIRRELALIQAALNHNKNEERIKDAPKFVKPAPGEARMRWLTREEYHRLMDQPMTARTRMFLIMAFGMGMRSKAIEEAEWTRLDWSSKTLDFRVPGVKYRNKRRVIAPIGDVVFGHLELAYSQPTRDKLVIGKGGCTFRHVKKLMRAVGVDEAGVCRHVARHTFCSWLVQRGISYAIIGALVGDSAAMIEKTYGHLSPAHTRDAANLALLAA